MQLEKAGVEKSGVDSMGGKCRSDNGWKAVRKEKYKIPMTLSRACWCIVTKRHKSDP